MAEQTYWFPVGPTRTGVMISWVHPVPIQYFLTFILAFISFHTDLETRLRS
jgi:hypothetical protein